VRHHGEAKAELAKPAPRTAILDGACAELHRAGAGGTNKRPPNRTKKPTGKKLKSVAPAIDWRCEKPFIFFRHRCRVSYLSKDKLNRQIHAG
jgi:hypothetical protein